MLVFDPGGARYKLGYSPGHAVCTNYGWNDDDMIPDPYGSAGAAVAHKFHRLSLLSWEAEAIIINLEKNSSDKKQIDEVCRLS
jgi:hypothetical protein